MVTLPTQPQDSFVKSHLVDALGIVSVLVLALVHLISGMAALGAILTIVGARTGIASWKIFRWVLTVFQGMALPGTAGGSGGPGDSNPPGPGSVDSVTAASSPSSTRRSEAGPPSAALVGLFRLLLPRRAVVIK